MVGLFGRGHLAFSQKFSQNGFFYHNNYAKIKDLVYCMTGSEPHFSVHVFRLDSPKPGSGKPMYSSSCLHGWVFLRLPDLCLLECQHLQPSHFSSLSTSLCMFLAINTLPSPLTSSFIYLSSYLTSPLRNVVVILPKK